MRCKKCQSCDYRLFHKYRSFSKEVFNYDIEVHVYECSVCENFDEYSYPLPVVNEQLKNRMVTSFIFYYCTRYMDVQDPYGYFGHKTYRAIKTHMKLSKINFNEELNEFINDIEMNDILFDCLVDIEGEYYL